VTVMGLLGTVTAISTGDYDTCALISSGAIQCWGQNDYGQLGNGNTTQSSVPVTVMGLPSAATAIGAGPWHTCAVINGGAVWCWGRNHRGQLGNGSTTSSTTPVQVGGSGGGTTPPPATTPTTVTSPGGAVLGIGTSDGSCAFSSTVPADFVSPAGLPAGVTAPDMAFKFAAAGCTPGASMTVTLTLPSAVPDNTSLFVYDGHWSQYMAVINGNTLRYVVTDGGLGDSDGVKNGVIVNVSGLVRALRSYTAATATSTGTANATISSCSFDAGSTRFVNPPPGLPAGVTLPDGAFQFIANACPVGGTAKVTLTMPHEQPPGTVFWKFDGARWMDYPATINGNVVTYFVTDGGPGDADGVANGVIVDPGGPGPMLKAGPLGGPASDTVPVPTLSQWTLLLLSALLGLLALGSLRVQRRMRE
jgi:hypothetical protein